MKKRWLSLLLITVLLLVSACSNDDDEHVHKDDKYGENGKICLLYTSDAADDLQPV